MFSPIRLIGLILKDPWRKGFALLVAVVLWSLMFNQIVGDKEYTLTVRPVALVPVDLISGQLFIVEPRDWHLVQLNDRPISRDSQVTLDLRLQAPNDVLAEFGSFRNPNAKIEISEELLLKQYDDTTAESLVEIDPGDDQFLRWEVSTDPQAVSTSLSEGGQLRLKFRRFKRKPYPLDASMLDVRIDGPSLRWDSNRSSIKPTRISIELPLSEPFPGPGELFAPIQITSARAQHTEPLVLRPELIEKGFSVVEPINRLPEASLIFEQVAPPPRELRVELAAPRQVRPYFLGVDLQHQAALVARVDLDTEEIVEFRLVLAPGVDEASLSEILEQLKRYVYFTADLTSMLERKDGVGFNPSEDGSPFKLEERKVPITAHVDESFFEWTVFKDRVKILPAIAETDCFVPQ